MQLTARVLIYIHIKLMYAYCAHAMQQSRCNVGGHVRTPCQRDLLCGLFSDHILLPRECSECSVMIKLMDSIALHDLSSCSLLIHVHLVHFAIIAKTDIRLSP